MNDFLIFNSYYRSANVFLFFLSRRTLAYPTTTKHEPGMYQDKTQKQAVMFRNPYDCIPSVIYKQRVDANIELPTFTNSAGIENDIEIAAKEYLYYIKTAKENFDNIYIGRFESMIKDPVAEIEKIAKFFNLPFIPLRDSYENVYNEIKNEMFNQRGPVEAEHLMSPHDGHLPREKTEARLAIDQYVKNSYLGIIKDCYNAYLNMKYTEI